MIKKFPNHKFWSRDVKLVENLNNVMCRVYIQALNKETHMSFYIYIYIYIYKAVPLQAWSGPQGSRKLRFPDFMTTAQDGGKVVSLTHRPSLPSINIPGTHFC